MPSCPMHLNVLLALELRHDLKEEIGTGPKSKREVKKAVESEVNSHLDSSLSLSPFLTPIPTMGSVLLQHLGQVLTSVQESLSICNWALGETHRWIYFFLVLLSSFVSFLENSVPVLLGDPFLRLYCTWGNWVQSRNFWVQKLLSFSWPTGGLLVWP